MVSAVSSAASASGASAAPASAGSGLDAALARCETQLSDWVHCPSSKTPEGKAKIAEISAQRDAIKQRIAQREGSATSAAEPGRDTSASTRRVEGTGATDGTNRTRPQAQDAAQASDPTQSYGLNGLGGPNRASRLGSLGGYLDTYA